MQRDLPLIRGQLLIGDARTPGNFFDSVPFRGAQISSDDAMLPNSLQGYAPTIRGVAQTNARVSVRQNGYLVYSTYVAPGPFVLDDLYPTASSGDLEVTITEADGRETRYIQAFAAVPTLLREGAWRYSATAGEYRHGDYDQRDRYDRYDRYGQYDPWGSVRRKPSRPFFTQGTAARGLGGEFTLYGGATLSDNYQSLLSGVGKNLRDFGAVSLDMSYAHTFDRNNSATSVGHSLRFLYNKSFVASGTDFRLAGYRYSTSGYRSFEEFARIQEPRNPRDLQDSFAVNSRRNELRFEMAQSLGDWGSMYVSARQQSYWGASSKDRLVQMGYSGFFKQLSYNVYYNYSSNLYGPARRQVAISLSIPLGGTRASAQYMASSDTRGRVSQRASVYGSAFDDSRLTYNVTTGHTKEQGADGSLNASYLSPFSRFDAGRSQGQGYGQTTLGMAGGVLVHGGGVTLSQPLGETIALVQAPKAEGVGVESRPGVRTDSAGNAVVPSLSPYRTNRLALRTEQLGDTVEVRNAAVDLVPTRGAVVLAKYETSVGFRLMMTLVGKNGQPLPFGSKIENETGQEVGIVGPDGQSFVTGAGNAGRLNVKWGRGDADQCTVPYSVPEEQNPSPIRELQGRCE
jgi:outer membrane usher protein